MQRILLLFFLLLCLLPACAGQVNKGAGLAVGSEHFSEALRWLDFSGAANHLHIDVRGEFLDLFQADDDLKIVESQIVSVELDEASETATIDYRMEYYRLPSMRIKKWQWQQQWRLEQKNAIKSGVWLIVNSPPPVP